MSISLTLASVLNFLQSTVTSRNFLEGERIINAGHIVLCGTTGSSDSLLNIVGLCLQTSQLRAEPHEIKGTIDIGDECKPIVMSCSCKAGSEQCKHVAAILLYCTRNDLLKLESLSSTDLKCYWKQHKHNALQKYEPEPLETITCIGAQRVAKLPCDLENTIRETLLASSTGSAINIHKARRRKRKLNEINNNQMDNCSNLHINKAISAVPESVYMISIGETILGPLMECCQATYANKIVCLDFRTLCQDTFQSKDLWRKERQFRITGSRCYEIYTYKKNEWSTKCNKYFWPTSFTNKFVKHGIQFEPVARATYSRMSSVNVIECGLVVSPQNPFLGYSPDGIILKDGEPWKLLEIKCPFKGQEMSAAELSSSCKFLETKNGNLFFKKKHQYYAQVQLGMAILNLKKCDFIIYSSKEDNFLKINIDFDEIFTIKLLKDLKYKYFNYMLHNICLTIETAI